MYTKHIWRWEFGFEYTEGGGGGGGGVLDHLVRKTYHIYMHPNSACTQNTFSYMHSGPNSACMQNTFFVHAAILHVNIWRWGVLAQLVLKTYHIYTRGLRLLCNKKKSVFK